MMVEKGLKLEDVLLGEGKFDQKTRKTLLYHLGKNGDRYDPTSFFRDQDELKTLGDGRMIPRRQQDISGWW